MFDVTNPAPGQFLLDFDKSLGDLESARRDADADTSLRRARAQYELDMPTGSVGVGFFT